MYLWSQMNIEVYRRIQVSNCYYMLTAQCQKETHNFFSSRELEHTHQHVWHSKKKYIYIVFVWQLYSFYSLSWLGAHRERELIHITMFSTSKKDHYKTRKQMYTHKHSQFHGERSTTRQHEAALYCSLAMNTRMHAHTHTHTQAHTHLPTHIHTNHSSLLIYSNTRKTGINRFVCQVSTVSTYPTLNIQLNRRLQGGKTPCLSSQDLLHA